MNYYYLRIYINIERENNKLQNLRYDIILWKWNPSSKLVIRFGKGCMQYIANQFSQMVHLQNSLSINLIFKP